MNKPLQSYLHSIADLTRRGDAREESYYFTADAGLFRRMAALGGQLIDLHLLRGPGLSPPLAKYQGTGDDRIQYVRHDPAGQRVHINPNQYFEGVAPEMWEYQIGGYQVLEKYLKDRKGRRLEDPIRYIHIATAIARTIDLQREIDRIYPEVERNVLQRRESAHP